MKVFRHIMVFVSGALFVISATLLMIHFIVIEADIVFTTREIQLISVICVFSASSLVIALSFPYKLYKRTMDIDAIEMRYGDAVMKLHQATKLISDKILKTVVDDVVKEIRLPSLLEEQAKDIAKDFSDVVKSK